MGEMGNAYKILIGKPEGKRLLERPTHTWEVAIRTDLRDMRRGVLDRIYLAQDKDQWWALVKTAMDLP
jgi:hypothetical protein